MTIKQVSVFVENKQGKLLEIISLLGKSGVDLRAMSIADTADFGVLRLICDNPYKAQEVLTSANCIVTINEVVGVAVPDSPGGLSSVLEILNDTGLSIEYIYAFITHNKDQAYIILRLDDNERATEILQKNNVPLLTTDDVIK